MLVVAEVSQQVVVAVAKHGGKESVHLVMRDFQGALNNRVPNDGLPDVVVNQIQVLY